MISGTCGGGRVGEQFPERFLTDVPGADVLVTVLVGAHHVLGVVGMDQFQPSLADRVHQEVQGSAHARRAGQIVARRVDVAGVEADAELGVGVESLEVRAEVPGP